MEFRKVFDLIPEEFDKYRPKYCKEAFDDIIEYCKLDSTKKILEIGPGTGQASEPLLQTGCNYTGIEIGKHLYEFMRKKFKKYENCKLINDDFCIYDFGNNQYDVIFSAATIQWIPEEIAFKRCFNLLKPGGYLIMIANISNEKAKNSKSLIEAKDDVYKRFFKPEIPYTCKINKENVINYGFYPIEITNYEYDISMTADEFVNFTMTHADHILLKEPNRSSFINALKETINNHGGVWNRHDRVNIVKTRKPLTE